MCGLVVAGAAWAQALRSLEGRLAFTPHAREPLRYRYAAVHHLLGETGGVHEDFARRGTCERRCGSGRLLCVPSDGSNPHYPQHTWQIGSPCLAAFTAALTLAVSSAGAG